jgi:hypothetical protein
VTSEHALDRTARLVRADLFGQGVSTAQVIDGLMGTTVLIHADETDLSSPAGQTALCALFGQVAMMGIGIELDIPDMPLLVPQPPLTGTRLRPALLDYGNDLIPGAHCGTGQRTADLTFTLGATTAPNPLVVRVTGGAWSCAIGVAGQTPPQPWMGSWPVGALLAAASAAPEALRAAVRKIATATGREPTAEFHTLPGRSVTVDLSSRAIPPGSLDVGPVDVISGGAITNAAIYALLRIPRLSVALRIIEPETIDITNLNRYPLGRRSDEGKAKTAVLENYSRGTVKISGVVGRFDESWPARLGSLAPRVLIGADQIPARWAAQLAEPQWLQVTGTSHFLAMASTHHSDGPCAGCAHPKDEPGSDPIPTISFVSLWAGILQALDLLNDASRNATAGHYAICYPFGLGGGSHAIIQGRLSPAAGCPVSCRASQRSA